MFACSTMESGKPSSYGIRFIEAFCEDMIPSLVTTDRDFVLLAIKAMSTPEDAPFTRHHTTTRGRHVLALNMDMWDPGMNMEQYFAAFDLQAPSEFSMVMTMPRPSAVVDRTLCVDMVPEFVTVDDVMDALHELNNARCSSWSEEEIADETSKCALMGLANAVRHRNILVSLKCDLDDLGSVLSRGLMVEGMTFRARMVLRTSEEEPHPVSTKATQTETEDKQTPPRTQPKQPTARPRSPPRPTSRRKQAAQRAAKPSSKTPTPHPPPPVKQCYRCQCWGHVSSECPNPPRCRKCSQDHVTSSCKSEDRRCAVCQGQHAASSRSCKERPLPPPPAKTAAGSARRRKGGSELIARIVAAVMRALR